MAEANIRAVITAEDRASRVLSGFGGHVDSVGKKIIKTTAVMAAAVTAAVGVAVIRNIDDAVKRLDTLNNSARAFENMGFAAEVVQSNFKELDRSIRGLPTSLDSAVRGMTMLTASTGNIDKSRKVFQSLNNAIIGFGGSAEQVDNAVIQLSQDLGSGRITAQTWLSMMNSGLTPALAAMSRQMGITTTELKEGLSAGTISVEQFQDSLIEMNEKGGGGMKSFEKIARDATGGIQTSIANMNTAIARGLANLMNAIGRDRIANFISGIGTTFESVVNKVVALGPAIINVFSTLGNVISNVFGWFRDNGPAIINAVREAIEALRPNFQNLSTVLGEDLFPALKRLWDEVLRPLAPYLGGALVLAIATLIDVLAFLARALSVVINVSLTLGQKIQDVGSFIYRWYIGPIVELIGKVWELINALRELQKEITNTSIGGARGGALSRILGRQHGGPVMSGQPYIVGEAGPELFVPDATGDIIPNGQMGGGANITIAPQIGVFTGTAVERRKLAQQIFNDLKDIASSQGMSLDKMVARA